MCWCSVRISFSLAATHRNLSQIATDCLASPPEWPTAVEGPQQQHLERENTKNRLVRRQRQTRILPMVCSLFAGAGQDVGRSCVVVRIGGKTLMFDCGMHMGYQDARRSDSYSTTASIKPYITPAVTCSRAWPWSSREPPWFL